MKTKKGFTIIELLLVIIIFCFILLVGYYIYHHTGTRKALTTSSTTTSNDSSDLIKRARYVINYDNDNRGRNVAENLYSQGYITQSLLAYLQQNQFIDSDMIICAQAPANSWSYSKPVISNNNATASLKITGKYGGSGANVITTDWINTGNSWKENAIVCPMPH